MAKTLTLNLKGEYFDAIRDGSKTEEYRQCKSFWRKRIEGKTFDCIVVCRGYPPRGPSANRMTFPWCGYEIKTITHPNFGDDPVEVFAIRVTK